MAAALPQFFGAARHPCFEVSVLDSERQHTAGRPAPVPAEMEGGGGSPGSNPSLVFPEKVK